MDSPRTRPAGLTFLFARGLHRRPVAHRPARRSRGGWRALAIHCLAGIALVAGPSAPLRADTSGRGAPVPSIYDSQEKFLAAIEAARKAPLRRRHATGLTLPHHILAGDLIAKGLATVDPTGIKTVVILSPDHFKKAQRPFATTRRDFETVLGDVATSKNIVERLLVDKDLVEPSSLFEKEHGVQVLLPFIKHYLPNAQIVPIAVAIRSRRTSWDRMADLLARSIDDSTLIIQSTDFSHYLPAIEAARHDQKVLNALALGDLQTIAQLRQPDDIDSAGSQYLQAKLQRDVFRASPDILYNGNSQSYSDVVQAKTTSYLVALYDHAEPSHLGEAISGSSVYCFAGDTFLGRWVAEAMADVSSTQAVEAEMAARLDRCPLIVNLEGVVSDRIPHNLRPSQLVMSPDLVRRWLRSFHVMAVSLANNHVKDLGAPAYEAMQAMLVKAGVAPLPPFGTMHFGAIDVTAMTDLDNSTGVRDSLITDEQIAALAGKGRAPPRIAFLHWGQEFETMAGDRQRHLAERLGEAGFGLIVGAHPHRRSARLERVGTSDAIEAYSLGNFLFDQSAPHASGALLAVRVFRQGTFFARLVPIPNYFDALRRARAADYCCGSRSGGGKRGLK